MSKTINDIITSIAVIPDPVSRSVYIKTTAQIFEMDEQLLILEVQKNKKQNPYISPQSSPTTTVSKLPAKAFEKGIKHDLKLQEKKI